MEMGKYFDYLEQLRDSGETNMFGAKNIAAAFWLAVAN